MSQSESSGNLTPTWYYNLGEGILNIMALPLTSTETVIVILGEKNLYCLTDLGKLKFMKKLDFVPICLHAYVIGWYWGKNQQHTYSLNFKIIEINVSIK